jgi:RNA polymerase sigma-70 factor (ECF subfamily)
MDSVAADGRRSVPAVGEDFERLFRGSYPRLVVALALLADRAAAEDAVQDAFVQALRHWQKVRHYDDPAAWVRRAALHRLANQRRGAARRDRAVERIGSASVAPEVDHAGLADLRAALADLPDRERTVVVFHHVIGLPVAEIAHELGLPEGTVKSVLARARARLRAVLDPPAAAGAADRRGEEV